MLIEHGIALLFAVVFMVIATIFRKVLWWLVAIGYLFACAYMAILNSWELLFFVPLTIFAMIAIIGFIYSALKGEIV